MTRPLALPSQQCAPELPLLVDETLLSGVGEVHAGLLPAEKLQRVIELQDDDDVPVAMVGDGVNDGLPEAIGLSHRALSIMRANIIASLAVKAVFVILAPFGLVTLVMAVAADMGMSLLVALNAMRLHGRSTPNTGTIPAGPVDPCTKRLL